MPVTKTAKRALRGSKKKESVNRLIVKNLEVALRIAKRTKARENILRAISLSDRAVKKGIIHKNKAARTKSQLSKLLPTKKQTTPKKPQKKKVVA